MSGRHPVLRISDVHKRFVRSGGEVVSAIDGVSLDVSAGEVVVLLGPSGCGKTTLLRAIAGLDEPDTGRIELNGDVVFDRAADVRVPTERRCLSMVFQSYALWPHLTAFENVAYPLRARRQRQDLQRRVATALEMVGIPDLQQQYPAQMSGGQQQRVALARALVSNDQLILFDEPMSNVDARVREELRYELAEMQARIGFAAVYVTHDQVEAMSLAHHVAVMGAGQVQQFGTPAEIYDYPVSRYVAQFVGTSNDFPGTVKDVAGDRSVTVETRLGIIEGVPTTTLELGTNVFVTFRPERSHFSHEQRGGNCFRAEVRSAMFVGSHVEYVLDVSGIQLRVWESGAQRFAVSDVGWLSVQAEDLRVMSGDGPEPKHSDTD